MKRMFFRRDELVAFFEANEPDTEVFQACHIRIAEYLLLEQRRSAQAPTSRTFILHGYRKPLIVDTCILMLTLQYKFSEIYEVFREFNTTGVKQLLPDASPKEITAFANKLEVKLSQQRSNQPEKFVGLTTRVRNRKNKPSKDKNNDGNKVVCYKCNKPGHTSPQCNKNNEEYIAFVKFIWDLGSEAHVVNDMSYYWNFREVLTAFETVNGKKAPVYSLGYGDVIVKYGNGHQKKLTNVHYIPQSGTCLFSHGEGKKDGLFTSLILKVGEDEVQLDNGEVIGRKQGGSQIYVDFEVVMPRKTIFLLGEVLSQREGIIDNWNIPTQFHLKAIFSVAKKRQRTSETTFKENIGLDSMAIHRKYGHPNEDQFKKIKILEDLGDVEHIKTKDCVACAVGRSTMHRPKFSHRTKVDYPIQILHVDICGPFPDCAYDGSRYFLTVVDDYSRYVFAVPLAVKNQAMGHIQNFINKSYAKFRGKNFCVGIRTDNAGEFLNSNMRTWMFHKGIDFERSIPGSSHQNGTAERKQRDIQTKVRTLLADANMPTVFWPDALRASVEILNWTPTLATNYQRPVDVWNGEKMTFYANPVFGTLAYVHIPSHHPKSALFERAVVSVYLGPAQGKAAGRFYSHEADTIFDSDQALFDSLTFYFDQEFPEFRKKITRWRENAISGIGGLPPLPYHKPKVSRWEYENLFKIVDPSLQNHGASPENEPPLSTQQTEMNTEGSLHPEVLASPPVDTNTSVPMQNHAEPSFPVQSDGLLSTPDIPEILGISNPEQDSLQPEPQDTEMEDPPATDTVADPIDEPIDPLDDFILEDASSVTENIQPAQQPDEYAPPLPVLESSEPTSALVQHTRDLSLVSGALEHLPTDALISPDVVSTVAPEEETRLIHRPKTLPLVARKTLSKKLALKKLQRIPRNRDAASNALTVLSTSVTKRNRDLAMQEAPSWYDQHSDGPVASRLRSAFAMDPRFKRHDQPMDHDQGIYPPQNKQRRLNFLQRIFTSGGIFLLSQRPSPVYGDKDVTTLEEQSESSMIVQDIRDIERIKDSDIDWVPTILRLASMERETVPKNYNMAVKLTTKLNWLEACDKEMKAHASNGTFKLVKLPENRKAIGCQWVFAKKDNGLYKARLVALGNLQKEGIDYSLTFSPVIRYTSLRLVLAIAAKERLFIRQWDVSTAFLNGKLDEEIYMIQPQGYVAKGKEDYVLKLEKSLYGLKQAPHVWHKTVRDAIIQFGFLQSTAEPCIFFKFGKKGLLLIALYVDDMLVFGPCEEDIAGIQTLMFKRFEMKNLGVPQKFLGMNLSVTRGRIEISLEDYIDKMLEGFQDISERPTRAPIGPLDKLHKKTDDEEACDETKYRSLTGKLVYAANTARPDLAYVTLHLSQFLEGPSVYHMRAAYKVLRYLSKTKYYSICYCASDSDVTGYSDSDYAMWSDRKSRSGIIFKYANSPVMWMSKMQTTIATSTLTAELAALYEATREAIWIKRIFKELKISLDSVFTQLWCDNIGTINTVNNVGFHEGVKHEEVRSAYVQEKINDGSVKVDYIPTKENIADMFTKALEPGKLMDFIKASGMRVPEYKNDGSS